MSGGPSSEVLRAFGLQGRPVRLRGGQGTSWVADGVVLKPAAGESVQAWLGQELAGVEQVGFRLPEVRRARDGRWVVDGWGATGIMPGSTVGARAGTVDTGAWLEVLEAGRAFHRAVLTLPRPAWLADRDDWWARADAAAWGETPGTVHPVCLPLVRRLRAALQPLGVDQLVHGDLAGNVLLATGGPPTVIDVSPYWRPVAYAEGIVVADALSWGGAPPSLPDEAGVSTAAVARGLLFRLLTSSEMEDGTGGAPVGVALARDVARCTATADALGL